MDWMAFFHLSLIDGYSEMTSSFFLSFQLDSRENMSSSREPSLHTNETDNFSPVQQKGKVWNPCPLKSISDLGVVN